MNRATPRHGLSLLEVLISIFVVSIGLMSLAMLIPAGAIAINEANKSDRSGACGRAAMRQIKVARMLDPNFWTDTDNLSNGPFVIDPLGRWMEMPETFAGGLLARLGLSNVPNFDVADRVFRWQDDLSLNLPKDTELRSWVNLDDNMDAISEGHYSWFMTVTPSAAEADLPWLQKSTFAVSVVVCHGRIFNVDNEIVRSAQFLGLGLGGGTVRLGAAPVSDNVEPKKIRTNQWIMLCDATQCKWYRVVSAGAIPGSDTTLSLVGPDWHGTADAQAVIIQDVVGVYSTTVEIERNLVWSR
ncbi:MAG: prepilin-type N-terminal cleavage/methylation domain-containing protein [Candidatus Nealsonbacteria bacterium]|nr:prepilin-type N-terminal cleavage/methylation domain-containing protein [Candidatus Nealsonbacteria bacterium]